MSISPTTTRRRFLHQSLGTITILSMSPLSAERGSSTWVLAADPHINADPDTRGRGVNMTENLQSTVDQILLRAPDAEAVIINGDCAHNEGLQGDYRQFKSLLDPFREAGLNVLMTLGNHDNRHEFRHVFADTMPQSVPVADKHITVVTTPLANWFLLDSLRKVNEVTGELGEEQRQWLASTLDQFPNQPAIVVGHHHPQFAPERLADGSDHYIGLADSGALFDLLQERPQVQAYVHGHTHDWGVSQTRKGLSVVSLPPISYVFQPSRPSGWVRATVGRTGWKLELRSLDPQHEEHGQTMELAWR